ncbi:MAG: sigma-54-dependent Fis family transcriptional regulator, partial [Deltaproteobacteria bacterium]|nr:sigma-54-dependent Fis family transcriptional regulator [Deltaproteobacteria bacterium]
PPLRERLDDIPLLAEYFLSRLTKEMRLDNPGMTAEAKTLFNDYNWPGNVRELANTIQKALIFSRGGPIRKKDISQAIRNERVERAADEDTLNEAVRQWVHQSLSSGARTDLFTSLTNRFAKILISEALNLTDGNRTRAAKLLGVSRPTLLAKIAKYHLRTETSVKSDEF